MKIETLEQPSELHGKWVRLLWFTFRYIIAAIVGLVTFTIIALFVIIASSYVGFRFNGSISTVLIIVYAAGVFSSPLLLWLDSKIDKVFNVNKEAWHDANK